MLPATTNGDGDEVDEELTAAAQEAAAADAAPPPAAEQAVATDDGAPLSREAWLDEFERQSSEKGFEERLKRFARMRARMVAHASRTVDDNYVSELVQDAVEDVLDGKLIWDPRRISLKTLIYRTIESRTRHDYVRALKHVRFDPTAPATALSQEIEITLGREQTSASVRAEAAEVSNRVLAQLRLLAANDTDVLSLLDAYVDLACKRVDVLGVTDLSDKRYDAARKRLLRLVKMLPPDLVDAARSFT